MKLNHKQLETIRLELLKVKIYYTNIQDELLDHIASETEQLMKKGLDFDTAFRQAAQQVNPEKFQTTVLMATHLSKMKSIFKSFMEPMVLIKSLLLAALIMLAVKGIGLEIPFAIKWMKISFMILISLLIALTFKKKLIQNSNIVASWNSSWLVFCLMLPVTNYDLLLNLGCTPSTILGIITFCISFLFISGFTMTIREIQKMKTV
ncbi:MAG: hypothetical protein EA341_12015 [Mongoliibacter sp.]|uniref:hypothetical protein n=1 Tax=Mongoliibacter sp. TaxID=2022438 RepID=UPI0012F3981F|nr:hypothetical protein [Mongoliibacter sp.]TVP47780.1 MAG: hypothetical protein EA341_12015 [Mongoliibacter sp.]